MAVGEAAVARRRVWASQREPRAREERTLDGPAGREGEGMRMGSACVKDLRTRGVEAASAHDPRTPHIPRESLRQFRNLGCDARRVHSERACCWRQGCTIPQRALRRLAAGVEPLEDPRLAPTPVPPLLPLSSAARLIALTPPTTPTSPSPSSTSVSISTPSSSSCSCCASRRPRWCWDCQPMAWPGIPRSLHNLPPSKGNTSSIAPSTAAALSILYTLIYVLPFYLSNKTRPSRWLARDAPAVIKARIRSVTLSCILATLSTTYVAHQYGGRPTHEILHLLGWWPVRPLDILRSSSLVAILFAGPLFEHGVVEGNWRSWIKGGTLIETLSTPIGWRNYVAGPGTEEIHFRSTIIPLHLLATSFSPSIIVFLTPLYFGVAHLHHAYEFTLSHPGVPFLPVLFRTLFQFAYSSIFGFYAAFLFLRTGSLIPCILSHAFCNWMGLPRVWGRLEAAVDPGAVDYDEASRPRVKVDQNDGTRDSKAAQFMVDGRLGIGWTVAYYVLLVGGAWSFYANLWALTESSNELIGF